MKIINPKVEIIQSIDKDNIFRLLEYAGRTCYKTDMNNNSEEFLRKAIKRGHLSIIEHEKVSFKIVCDRGVTHEIVRHRLASYSQECVSGDTKVHRKYTIKELFDRENGSCYDRTHNKTIKLKSCDQNKVIVPNKFTKIFYKGIQDIYKITTKLGYTLKCTLDHEFSISNNYFVKLRNLNIGDKVLVNGRPCLVPITNEKLKHIYLKEKLSPLEISKMLSCPYSSVLRKLQEIGVFIPRLNDKNKRKYNKNHTKESYIKMRKIILRQYKNGRTIWNKGLKEHDNTSVKRQANALREFHHNNGFGKRNSNYGGGPKEHCLAQLLKRNISQCEICGDTKKLEVHHKDNNPSNNISENIIKICCRCHNMLHHGWYIATRAIEDEIVSIEYVGKERTYDLEMNSPYHNYIANGFVVHNSTRYCNYSKDKFGGQVTFILPFWFRDFYDTNSQSTTRFFDDIERDPAAYDEDTITYYNLFNSWFRACSIAEKEYLFQMDHGASPQMARDVLPNSTKTEIVITMNLRELMYFLNLRTKPDCHPQLREVTIPLLRFMKSVLPIMFDDIECNNEFLWVPVTNIII